jgi:molybdopterin converting factor small subunit
MMMNVNILFFGALVEITQTATLTLTEVKSSDEALELLHKKFPMLCHYKFSLALNQKFLVDNAPLKNGDELALLPPFAGG